MHGINFFQTNDLEAVDRFYRTDLGCALWLDQGTCRIYRAGNQLVGFCFAEKAEICGTITFFFAGKAEVDAMYSALVKVAEAEPADNPHYRIYHFFARDPEGRRVEFQCFGHAVDTEFS